MRILLRKVPFMKYNIVKSQDLKIYMYFVKCLNNGAANDCQRPFLININFGPLPSQIPWNEIAVKIMNIVQFCYSGPPAPQTPLSLQLFLLHIAKRKLLVMLMT